MKFNFYDKESKIYDLLQMPRVFFALEEHGSYEEEKHINPLEELNDHKHIDMVRDIHNRLKPFKKEISEFYANEFFSDYDFFALLTNLYSFFGYETIDDYLNYVMSIEEQIFKVDLVYALLSADSDNQDDRKNMEEKAKELVNKQAELMQFVKDLPTESSFKWNLLMMLENPNKMVKQFAMLMKQLAPIYDEFYQERKEKVFECEERLTEILKDDPKENFNRLTQYMINDDLLKKENKVLLSIVFAYSFIDKKTRHGNFLVWGISMEEGFKHLSKQYGDKIEKTTKVFKILGDKTRYEVLKLIAKGTTSTKEIAKQLGVTSATISYHINSFVTNGVIRLSNSSKHKYVVDFDLLSNLWEGFISDLDQE